MKIVIRLFAVIYLLFTASLVQAEQGVYIGFGVGSAEADVTLDDVAALDDGSIISASLDDSDTSISLALGYQFNNNFSIEGGYVDLGEIGIDAVSDGTGFLYFPGPVTLRADATGLFFDVKGQVPVSESFNLYGKVGLLKWDADVTLSDSTGGVTVGEDGSDVFYGVGASFDASTNISIYADYILYTLDDLDIDVLSVGLLFRI